MKSFYNQFANYIEKRFKVDAHYFLKGGFWLTAGQATSILFGLITTVLFAHYLSESDYGIYKYLTGLAAILASFSLTGLGQAILQASAKKIYGFYRKTMVISFKYNLTVALFSLATAFYYWFNENMVLALGCLMIGILQPFINTFQFIPTYLLGRKQFKETTILQTVKMLIVSVVSIVTLFYTNNIIVLFFAYLFISLITNLVSHLVYNPKKEEIQEEIFAKYLNYAKHTSLRNIISVLVQKADTVIIFTQLGAVELAVYSIATVVPEQIKGSLKNLSNLLLPKYAAHSNLEQLKKSVPKRSLQLFVLLLLITIIYLIVAPYLYQFIFPKYPDAIFYSQISALSLPAFILFIPFNILQAQLQEKVLYKLTLYSSLFQIIVVAVGILYFGLLGAIIARIGYRIFYMVIVYFYLYKSEFLKSDLN
ncbi:oligosaccharide flippase family protein [Candidatus Nomurabacteria bacterium]|nr:oligosaccharide flippase family protein [Candidatus Nomurabacteria bacterium]